MIKTEQLYYLTQVAKYHSINKAAEELYMTKAAVSTAIKQLEKDCGYQILERTYRGVRLTEKGQRVIRLAEQVLSLCEEIEQMGKKPEPKIEKNDLFVTALTLNLLSQRIIGMGSKTMKYFNIIEVANHIEDICSKVTGDSIALLVLRESQKKIAECNPDIEVRALYNSAPYLVSSKTTKHIKNNQKNFSKKEFALLPKIAMSNLYEEEENTVLKTGNLNAYTEAILNDYGVGILANFSNDIFCVDRTMFKYHGTIDSLEDLWIVILYRTGCNENVVNMLEQIIKKV